MGKKLCTSREGLRKGVWTEDEDQKLLSIVQQYGDRDWKSIAQKAGLMRCGKSCRLRWANYLRPGIKRGHFSADEEETIIRLHAAIGNRWATIARHLYKRTDNEVKNYWNTRLKKRVAKDCLPQADGPSRDSPNVSSTSTDNCEMIDDSSVHQMPSDTRTSSSSSSSSSSFSSSSSAKVLNLIASHVHFINLGRFISDFEIGSLINHPQSSNTVRDETRCIESMESLSSIEKLISERFTDFDGPFSTGLMDVFYDNYSEFNV